MQDKKLKLIGAGIIVFLFIFLLIYIFKYQIGESTNAFSEKKQPSENVKKNFSSWKEYTSQVNHFMAEFPIAPSYDTETVPIKEAKNQFASLDVYLSQMPTGTLVMVRVLRFPDKYQVKSVKQLLTETMNNVLNANNVNKLKHSNDTTFQGHKALSFLIENPNLHIKGLSFFANNSVYTLIYASPPELFDDKVFEHFSGQFVVTTNFGVPPRKES